MVYLWTILSLIPLNVWRSGVAATQHVTQTAECLTRLTGALRREFC
jgi:hypothetical protein